MTMRRWSPPLLALLLSACGQRDEPLLLAAASLEPYPAAVPGTWREVW